MQIPFQTPVELTEATTTIPIKDATGLTIASVKYGPNDYHIALAIKTAVNCHVKLVNAVEALLQHIELIGAPLAPGEHHHEAITFGRAAYEQATGHSYLTLEQRSDQYYHSNTTGG